MKLTKREKTLLLVLCGMMILFCYFYFLILPQINKLKELKEVKAAYHRSIEEVETALESKDLIQEEIEEIQQEINLLSKNYFEFIDQGSIILLLDEWINRSGLHVPALTFSEYRDEVIADKELEAITLTVPFEGDYVALMELLKAIRSHEKRVLISQLNVQNDFDENIKGNILIDFYKLKDTKNNGRIPYITEETTASNKINPFSPFLGYIRRFYDFEENFPENYQYFPNPTDSVPATETAKIIMLNDFETLNTFFVGEPREIFGQLYLDKNALSGQHSLRLDYDFFRPKQRAVVNVVFEEGSIILQDQPEKIQLSLYTYSENGHSIALALKDSLGKEHIVTFAQQMNWRGWRQLETGLPQGISYPALLQRIVIEAKDFDPTTKVTLFIDQLEMVFPIGYTPIGGGQVKGSIATGKPKTYQVQKGDTLFSIAKKFFQDAEAINLIMEVNHIKNATEIFVGQNLIIPQVDGETLSNSDVVEYVVQKGDTLYSISRKFYNDPSKRELIMEYNGILNENHVEIGQALLIPKLQ